MKTFSVRVPATLTFVVEAESAEEALDMVDGKSEYEADIDVDWELADTYED